MKKRSVGFFLILVSFVACQKDDSKKVAPTPTNISQKIPESTESDQKAPSTPEQKNQSIPDETLSPQNQSVTSGVELKGCASDMYVQKMPPVIPSNHRSNLCLDLNGIYKVIELNNIEKSYSPHGLVWFYKNHSRHGEDGYFWHQLQGGEYDGIVNAIQIGVQANKMVICDQDGMDFLYMSPYGEKKYSERIRITKTEKPGIYSFSQCDGGWGEFGRMEFVSGPPPQFSLTSVDHKSELKPMEFSKIKHGKFLMVGGANNEQGNRLVYIRDFEIQKTELTQAQWAEVMGSNPSVYSKKEDCPQSFVQINKDLGECPNHPLENVSWNEITDLKNPNSFINRLNKFKNDGYLYRLPTEAEWEFAVRAGDETMTYFFGDDATYMPLYANYQNGNFDRGYGTRYPYTSTTTDVGSFLPNPWGLFDVYGNVSEFVSDRYLDVRDLPEGERKDVIRYVIRGGNNQTENARDMTSFSRSGLDPKVKGEFVGFRLVRVLKKQ